MNTIGNETWILSKGARWALGPTPGLGMFVGGGGGGVGTESTGAGRAVMGADSEIKCCSWRIFAKRKLGGEVKPPLKFLFFKKKDWTSLPSSLAVTTQIPGGTCG